MKEAMHSDPEIRIRTMTEDDLTIVEAIEQETFSVPWSFDAFEQALKLDYTLYLTAEYRGEIAGYCGMYISFDEGEIPNVAVAEKFRKLGIGRRMMEQLLDKAAGRGVRRAFLEVRAGNVPAISLYEGVGFAKTGVRKGFYDFPKEDAYVMQLELQE